MIEILAAVALTAVGQEALPAHGLLPELRAHRTEVDEVASRERQDKLYELLTTFPRVWTRSIGKDLKSSDIIVDTAAAQDNPEKAADAVALLAKLTTSEKRDVYIRILHEMLNGHSFGLLQAYDIVQLLKAIDDDAAVSALTELGTARPSSEASRLAAKDALWALGNLKAAPATHAIIDSLTQQNLGTDYFGHPSFNDDRFRFAIGALAKIDNAEARDFLLKAVTAGKINDVKSPYWNEHFGMVELMAEQLTHHSKDTRLIQPLVVRMNEAKDPHGFLLEAVSYLSALEGDLEGARALVPRIPQLKDYGLFGGAMSGVLEATSQAILLAKPADEAQRKELKALAKQALESTEQLAEARNSFGDPAFSKKTLDFARNNFKAKLAALER